MGVLQSVLLEKKAQYRQLMAQANVLTKQINDIERELKPKPAPASKPVAANAKPAPKKPTTAKRKVAPSK